MDEWQQVLKRSLTTVDELVERFGEENVDREAIQQAIDNFNLRITPEALQFVQKAGDAFWRQYVPTPEELDVHDGLVDALSEDDDSPVPNLTHRYPDRVLFLVSPVCATYCRFCTRRRKVGDPEKIPLNQFDAAFAYLREHTEVRDVILSGGDPFMLSDRRVEYFLKTLRDIPHIEIIRIHTRMPSHLPERITPPLCAILRKYHPVYVNVHFNHALELTEKATNALAMLADAGCPLGSQTVLMKGVNDDPATIRELMQALLRHRVRPYYLYQADQIAGAEHFRTSVAKGIEIIEALRGWTSGLAVPHFVIDAPGGGGKIPILPEYVEKMTEEEVVVRNYAGKRFVYRQAEHAVAASGRGDSTRPAPRRTGRSRPAEPEPAAAAASNGSNGRRASRRAEPAAAPSAGGRNGTGSRAASANGRGGKRAAAGRGEAGRTQGKGGREAPEPEELAAQAGGR